MCIRDRFEGDERHDIEILDVVSFLARQVEAKKSIAEDATTQFAQCSVDFSVEA